MRDSAEIDRSVGNLLSILIPVFNEERLLPRVLDSVMGLKVSIFILDSGSTDRTVDIAKAHGCQVFHGRWDSFSAKLNWGLANLPFVTPWVMRVDADEYLTEQLVNELRSRLATVGHGVDGLWVGRRIKFLGRWLRHGGMYPTEHLRILRVGRGRYEDRLLDEHVLISGKTIRLAGDIVEDPSKGLVAWSRKQISYAETECFMHFNTSRRRTWTDLEGTARRRRFLKEEVYAHSPLFVRPFGYWFYRYVLRLGFLDGLPGLIFHFLHAFWYRFLIDALLFEARQTGGDSVKKEHHI